MGLGISFNMRKYAALVVKGLLQVAFFVVLLYGINAVAAWSDATLEPPGDNVDGPLDASALSQYKDGALGIGGKLHVYNEAIFEQNLGVGTAQFQTSAQMHITFPNTTSGNYQSGTTYFSIDPRGDSNVWNLGADTSGFFHFADSAGIGTSTGGGTRMVIRRNSGNVGVGMVPDVAYELDVNGKINSNTGLCIRGRCVLDSWDGYLNDVSPEGSFFLPAAVLNQTIRNNGSGWVAAGTLYNTDSGIGIGTTTPQQMIDIVRTDDSSGIMFKKAGVASDPLIQRYTAGVKYYPAAGFNDPFARFEIGLSSRSLGVESTALFLEDAGMGVGEMDSISQKLTVAGNLSIQGVGKLMLGRFHVVDSSKDYYPAGPSLYVGAPDFYVTIDNIKKPLRKDTDTIGGCLYNTTYLEQADPTGAPSCAPGYQALYTLSDDNVINPGTPTQYPGDNPAVNGQINAPGGQPWKAGHLICCKLLGSYLGVTGALVNDYHTQSQCTAAGGTVVSDAGYNFCRFDQRMCPSGWTRYKDWSATSTDVACSADPVSVCVSYLPWGLGCRQYGNVVTPCMACTISAHTWQNLPTTCTYSTNTTCSVRVACPSPASANSNAHISSIGCF